MKVYVLIYTYNADWGTETEVLGVFKSKEKVLEKFKEKRKEIIKTYKEEEYEEDYRESSIKKGYFYISATEGWDSLQIEEKELED